MSTTIPLLAESENLQALRDHAKTLLVEAVNSMPGKKVLVLDPALSGPFSLICEWSHLRELGVEKVYHLTPYSSLETPWKNVLYMTRPKMPLARYVASQIKKIRKKEKEEGETQRKQFSVFFVPRRTMICEHIFEEEGVMGDIHIGVYKLDLIPFESDLLSLEMDGVYRECHLDGDRTGLFYVAQSLMRLQTLFGVIPNIKGKGQCAKLVMDNMIRMRRELNLGNDGSIPSEIDNLILIDRSVDVVTPFLTQLTYEGLIDEIFRIRCSKVDVDPELLGKDPPKEKGQKAVHPLNNNDTLYQEIRDQNFGVISQILNSRAQHLKETYDKRHAAKTVAEIKDFVKQLNSLEQEKKALRIHIGIAEKISEITRKQTFMQQVRTEQDILAGGDPCEYIEECINKQEPLVKVLRLLILLCVTTGGLKQNKFDFFRKELLQTYGFQQLFLTLDNLEKLGLLRKQEGKNTWPQLRKALNLLIEDLDETRPGDIAYTFSGYAPISVRLVQAASRPGGWKSIEEALRVLPGPTVEETQVVPGVSAGIPSRRKTVTLVYFIGGVTHAEIAAIRFLAKNDENADYIIATTKMINGDGMVESLTNTLDSIPVS